MIANHKGEIPFMILIIPFLVGIASGSFFMANGVWWPVVAFAALGAVFLLLNLNYARFKLYKANWVGGALISAILFTVGWLSVALHNELNDEQHFSKIPAQYVSARINNEPTVKGKLVRFTASVTQSIINKKTTIVKGTLLVIIKDSLALKLAYGDELLLPATYTAVEPPRNPAEFNYKKYLAGQNIHQQAFLYPGQYVITGHDKGNQLVAWSLKLRRRLVDKFKRHMRDTSAIAVASTLILGYKADLGNDILQAYSKTGTIHILSVSGGHVAIIYLLLAWALSFLNGYRYGRLAKAIIIIGLIAYYALLTGLSPAVCRAAVMIGLIIIGKTYSRYINQLNILAIAAFFMLLYDPYFISDVGFQLSYLAVGGLVVFQPMIYRWLNFDNWLANAVWMACSVSLAAQIITFPLSAFYFHQFPVYFLLSNLLIAIPVMIIMYAGLLYLLLPQIPFLSAALAYILERTILLMNKALVLIEHSPFASIGKIWLTRLEYLLLYGIVICLFYFIYNKHKNFLKLSMGLTLVLCVSISIKRVYAAQNNDIVILNLKRHLGIIFKQGDKAIILTDLDPADKNYRYSVQPYLDSIKVADTSVVSLTRNISESYFRKAGKLLQFQNTKLYVVDKDAERAHFTQKLQVDYLYITQNPRLSVTQLAKNFEYKLLLIAADNSDRTVERLSNEAKTAHANFKIIKRNNALSLRSN